MQDNEVIKPFIDSDTDSSKRVVIRIKHPKIPKKSAEDTAYGIIVVKDNEIGGSIIIVETNISTGQKYQKCIQDGEVPFSISIAGNDKKAVIEISGKFVKIELVSTMTLRGSNCQMVGTTTIEGILIKENSTSFKTVQAKK